jgi:hypothetical protein
MSLVAMLIVAYSRQRAHRELPGLLAHQPLLKQAQVAWAPLAVVSGGRVCRVDGRLEALTTPAMDAAEFSTIVERTAPDPLQRPGQGRLSRDLMARSAIDHRALQQPDQRPQAVVQAEAAGREGK